MLALDYRPSKRLLAALKLAAVYASGVTLLMMTLLSITKSPDRVLDMLPLYSIPAAICFAAAFLVLAVARRAGFTALWLIILSLWAWGLSLDFDSDAIRGGFPAWTLLAAPLYVMCAVGFRGQSSPARWRQWLSIAVPLGWAALYVVALRQLHSFHSHDFERRQYSGWWVWSWLEYAWLVAPLAITVSGILRVYSRAPTDAARDHGIAS